MRTLFEEGDEAQVDFAAGTITHQRTGQRLAGAPWPDKLLRVLRPGGLIEKLEAEGLLHPEGWTPAKGDASAAARRAEHAHRA